MRTAAARRETQGSWDRAGVGDRAEVEVEVEVEIQPDPVAIGDEESGSVERNIAAILLELSRQARSGRFVVGHGDREASIILENGRLVAIDVPSAIASLGELLAWREGSWSIEPARPIMGAALPLAPLLARARQWLEAVRAELAEEHDVLASPECTSPAIGIEDSRTIALLDGRRSLLSIVAERGDARRVAETLDALRLRGALGRPAPERPSPPPVQSGPFPRMLSWFRGASAARAEAEPPPSRARAARERPIPARVDPPARWDRSRAAVASAPGAIAPSLRDALEIELDACTGAEHDFVARLVDAAMGRLPQPSFPTPARSLADCMRGRAPSIAVLADMVGADVRFASRVLHAANAPVYGRRTDELEVAIARIGLDRVFRLAAEDALGAVEVGAPAYRVEQLAIRRTSLAVAATLAAIDDLEEPSCDRFLAGLLHEIGALEVHRIAALGPSPATPFVRAIVAAYQCSFGALLAARWELPESIVGAIATYPCASAGHASPLGSALRAAQIATWGALFLVEEPGVARALRAIPEQAERLEAFRASARAAVGRGIVGATMVGLGPGSPATRGG